MVKVSMLHSTSQTVSLCKQRKEIIKAAKCCRYDLVTNFVLYLDSLLVLGNSLNNYVEKELLIYDNCCGHLEFSSSSDSDSDLDSLLHHVDEEEPVSIHHMLEVEDESSTSDDEEIEGAQSTSTSTEESTPKTASPRIRKNNTHIPMSHGDFGHHEHSQEMETLGTPMYYFSHYNEMYAHYSTEAFPMGVPVVVPPSHDDPMSQMHGPKKNNTVTPLPTPAPPENSTWDFLYPFSMNNDVSYEHDLDEREIRKREGIPDLEEESGEKSKESEETFHSTMGVFYQKEMDSGIRLGSGDENGTRLGSDDGNGTRLGSGDGNGTRLGSGDGNGTRLGSSDGNGTRLGSGDGTSNVTQSNAKKGAFSNKGKELIIMVRGETNEKKCDLGPKTKGQDTESSETSLQEAVVDIRNQCKYLVDCGKEFSSVIEVAKRQHHSASTKLKGMVSGLAKRCLYPSHMSYQPAPKARLLSKADMKSNQDHETSSDLLSTLERLHVWEDKLYREVKGEEKLGILYDKQFKRLKEMDDKGFDPDQIDDALAAFKLLNSEMKVAVTSISAKSREIHELRDNKLLPELNKLIDGLTRLWTVMNTCHQKQFKAIKNAKSHVHILGPGNMKKKSSSKGTLRLEKVILNWGMCFRNFINTQKTLVKHLHNWLLRFILESTKDGTNPLLPSDAEAPPIFRVCNNWYQAIDKISEVKVSEAISTFASSLHQLYVKLKEEKKLKAKLNKLVQNYQHQLQPFCDENGNNAKKCDSFIKMKPSEISILDDIPKLRVFDEDLANSRRRLVELRKKHHEVFLHVNDVASSFLHEGLTPIFDALQSFCLENLRVYEQLRLPSSGNGTDG
ncbi:protein ROLLING AND ERECT LEAF 2-like [Lotus japonicus]|uniref:protein ROLLING AND ERECT LEAF 2-like n=1 Tax=Lotus japonicus TaxID=34305 RepID=UPI00258FD0B9|nr:protein ROLLING AND ERECT LEAF 2-like [Lotus japonicus]